MEATTKKKNFSFWSIMFLWLIFSDGSSTTKSRSDRAREFLVGRWTYYDRTAKPGERKGILVISPDGTCRVGKHLGKWDYENGFASITLGKMSNLRYYELDQKEETLTNHAHDGKTLTKFTVPNPEN